MLWYHICVTKTKFDYPLHSTFHIWQDFCPDTFWPSWHCLTPKFFDWQLIKNKSFKYNLECYSFKKRLLWIKSSDYNSSYELLLVPVTPKTRVWVWQNFCPGLYVCWGKLKDPTLGNRDYLLVYSQYYHLIITSV